MGICFSCIYNLFKKNNNTEEIKNNIQLNLKNKIIKKKYFDILKYNYNKNNIINEDSYILLRIKLNDKKNWLYIKTEKLIEYNEDVLLIVNSNKYFNLEKYEEIYTIDNENNLYTKPCSPYTINNISYEPDYILNRDKRLEFNCEINRISKNLRQLVELKRNKLNNN